MLPWAWDRPIAHRWSNQVVQRDGIYGAGSIYDRGLRWRRVEGRCDDLDVRVSEVLRHRVCHGAGRRLDLQKVVSVGENVHTYVEVE